MIAMALLGILLVLQADPTDDAAPSSAATQADGAEAEALAEYNARKARADMNSHDQWRLAIWCEQHGLEAEARLHFANVVQLDPKRDAAWKRLDYKKYKGRWMLDEQIAEAKIQEEANDRWADEFKAIHRHIHGGRRRVEAEEALARIEDPRAVPALYHEFADRSSTDQRILIQVLGQIRGPVASKTLASLAVYGVSADVRRMATETLRGRDAVEFVEFLLALMPDLIHYEVRPVGGPGSPGILLVEGERFNIRRFYAPPPPPNVTYRPGDIIRYDATGSPLIFRMGKTIASFDHGEVIGGTPMRVTQSRVREFAISPRLLASEALKGAASASMQLRGDIARIEAMNEARGMFKGLIGRVLKDATGQSLGDDVEPWRDWLADQTGTSRPEPTDRAERPRPTFNEVVPLAYKPYYGPAFNQVLFLRHAVPDS